jgi:hypothetical protein
MRIRIIDTPPGEAPFEIRRAWIGIILPVCPGSASPRQLPTAGVLTGPRHVFSQLLYGLLGRAETVMGYPVEFRVAIELLERHAPQAAEWWRANTPHLLEARRALVFHSHVCQMIADDNGTIGPELPNQALQTDGASPRR